MLLNHPKFIRDSVPRYLRRFCPDYHVERISDIIPSDLVAAGIKGVLLDVDNTLLPWKSHDIPEETFVWIEECRAAGLKMCIVSNTRNVPRLHALAEKMGIPYIRGQMKPMRDGFRKALREIGCSPGETVMVGDQMFTDVWGGNRMEIRTVWVEKMHPREFVGTKVSRLAEKLVLKMIMRAKEKIGQ